MKDAVPHPPTVAQVLEHLQNVYDPEFQASVVDLGLIYAVQIDGDGTVHIRMTLTSPGCPYAEMLVSAVINELEARPNIKKVQLEMVWEPPWSPDRMSPSLRYEHDMDFW